MMTVRMHLLAMLALCSRPLLAQHAPPNVLERRIDSIAAAAGVEVGVSVRVLESGAHASVRGGERFPMASVFKIPLALYVLSRVERGELSLDTAYTLSASDMRLGVSTIAEHSPLGGVTLTLHQLLDSILIQSDNSAADALLRIIGGPAKPNAWLAAKKMRGIRIDRSEAELAFDSFGVTKPPPRAQWTLDSMRAAMRRVPAAAQERAVRRFERDPRDTSTPNALTLLLGGIARHRFVNAEHSEFVLHDLHVTTTRPGRLRGLLPPGTESGHKSGTTAASHSGYTAGVNDVGIITLPAGKGHLAIAVFVRARTKKMADIEPVIARIARAAYDWAS